MKKFLLIAVLFSTFSSFAQSYKPLPGRVEAEDFSAMNAVATEPTQDVDGDRNVGWINNGSWMDYNVNVALQGTYTFKFRIANGYTPDASLLLKSSDGTVLGQTILTQTGGMQGWQTVTFSATLPQGNQTLRIYAGVGNWNFNWFEAVSTTTGNGGTGTTSILLPSKIEAEAFTSMSNVGTEPTSDTDGGQNVGWIQDNSWMDYRVNFPAQGYYTFHFRVANGWSPEATLVLKNGDGIELGRAIIPQTGGMQGWKTISIIAHASAGEQTLRIFAEKGGWNFNWIDVKSSRPLAGRMEAETFDTASDVRTESVNDTNGGSTVSYIDDNDWLDYNVNVATAGTYTLNFRVANAWGNGNIQIKNSEGNVLGSVDVPQTGGWQNYTTVLTTAVLPAGSQVIRLFANRGAFNFNWFELISGAVQGQSVVTFAELGTRNVTDGTFNLIATSTNSETPVIFSSSNPSIVAVSNESGIWKATLVTAGQATITASQAGNTNFLAASNVMRDITVVGDANPSTGTKIPIDPKRWYQLTNASNGLDGFFDGNTQEDVFTGWGKIINNYEAYYPLLDGEQITLETIKFFDFTGSTKDNPMILSVINDQWQRIPIASFTGEVYNGWVGPYPDRNSQFHLDASVSNIRYLVVTMANTVPTEIELYGSYTPPTQTAKQPRTKNIRIKDLFGVNGFEWNFQDGLRVESLVESKVTAAKSFTGLRHYMDWEKLESREGVYSYNPTLSGNWNYDLIYERCKQEGIEVLACLKTISSWMMSTYPEDQQDPENVPVRFGRDFAQPASYIEQAKLGFQYAARYGSNTNVDPSLLSVSTTPRWHADPPNTIKIGLDLVKYIECDNERDKWWKGRKGYQTAREYAANLSAFYDGHKNTMGAAVGIKNADPNMKVVIAGLVTGPDYVKGMVDWCKEFRGYNPDGTVNLCWDVVNFHLYTDNSSSSQSGTSSRGSAPEVTNANVIMDNFAKVTREVSNDLPLWITETGYDVHPSSPLKAIAIGDKSPAQTQADWALRSSLFAARHGVEKVFFYQMYDDNPAAGMFGSSGLLNDDFTRRPVSDFFFQTNKLFGNYVYKETIHSDPIVDRYELNGKSLFILAIPDEVGRTAEYTLNMNATGVAKIYTPKAGSSDMDVQEKAIVDGKITVTVTETPIFVIPASTSNARIAATEVAAPVLEVEEPLHVAVNVYPNPVSDFISIDLANQSVENVEIKIFDSKSGKLFRNAAIQKSGNKFSHQVNITQLPAGVYIIEIRQGNERAFRKVAKLN
jgi:endoglucanase